MQQVPNVRHFARVGTYAKDREPICRKLAIAPSSYHEHAARLADPARRPARARRDDEIRD